jgi:DNA polymerase-1
MITYYGKAEHKNDKEYILNLLSNPPEAISVDVETVSLDERMPLGFAIAFSPDEAIYFPTHPEATREIELLGPCMFNPAVCKIAHNMLFDMGVLPMVPHMTGFDRTNFFDTNTAARLLGRIQTDLPFLASEDGEGVGIEVTSAKSMLVGKKTMLDVDPVALADKCQRDARATYALYLKYKPQIDSQYKEYFKVETAVIPILIDLSMRGIAIDQDTRAEMEAKLEDEVEFYRRLINEAGIENPGSPQQVGYILGKRGNFLPLTKSKKQLSTREAQLQFLDDPLAAMILEFRGKSKLLSTYIKPMKFQDRFYTEYYLDTVVGRLNSKNRNIQNIPPNCRKILLPDYGCFTSGDYQREHLYILAHMSGDRDMLEVLYNPDPEKSDIHQHTAKKMGIPRPLAKTCNFAVAYGATAKTISEQAKIRDINFCGRLLDDWFRTYRGVADWVTSVQISSLRSGWSEPTLFGRRIAIPDEYNKWGALYTEGMKRKAVNYPVLGSDGEVIKRAILLCNSKGLGPPVMAITVHDSIDLDGDHQFPVEELEQIPGFRIPFEVKQTIRWE